ncbi:MAG: exodeoxyribonuclease VII small subunit [Gordonibacter sp.]|uniref:exodeoxyribonuclease VII small subunit n=1 Tax=Gordonibacter sp. TaxID=1968902 RepID=UPI002FCA2444
MALESYETFDAVKTRLDEIVDAVGSDELPLDDALSLYEEAVALGLRASNLLETDIEEQRTRDEACEADDEAGESVEDPAGGTEA